MEHKIKKHFSLFMVSKSIRKPNNKNKIHTVELILQSNQFPAFISQVPKFIDPITCYRLYGDIPFYNSISENGNGEVAIISNFNHFKRVVSISVNPSYLSLFLEKTSDELHSYDFLISRLNTLNNKDAHDLAQLLQIVDNHSKLPKPYDEPKMAPSSVENEEKSKYLAFCKELDDYCVENANTFFSMLRFKMTSVQHGLELKEIRYSKKSVEFFAEDIETYAHLVLEQGILETWVIEEKNYFSLMCDYITNLLSQLKQVGIYAKTQEGDKFLVKASTEKKMFVNKDFTELIGILIYEIEDSKLKDIKERRMNNKIQNKKSFREKQLEQTLSTYYGKSFVNDETKKVILTEGYEKNNIYLAEKKRCGVRYVA